MKVAQLYCNYKAGDFILLILNYNIGQFDLWENIKHRLCLTYCVAFFSD